MTPWETRIPALPGVGVPAGVDRDPVPPAQLAGDGQEVGLLRGDIVLLWEADGASEETNAMFTAHLWEEIGMESL